VNRITEKIRSPTTLAMTLRELALSDTTAAREGNSAGLEKRAWQVGWHAADAVAPIGWWSRLG
jgi:hypothetical protein